MQNDYFQCNRRILVENVVFFIANVTEDASLALRVIYIQICISSVTFALKRVEVSGETCLLN